MIRIYLILLLLGILFLGLRGFQKTPPEILARRIKTLLWLAAGLTATYLAATGRLNWLFALVGVAIAFAARLLPMLLRYAPDLHRLWSIFIANKQNTSHRRQPPPKSEMTAEEAYEVLGLQAGATKSEIIAAHRKLMQKMHPDHGGSNYLAAKINQAKKILLKE